MILMIMVPEELQEADVLWPEQRRPRILAPPPPAVTTSATDNTQKKSPPIKIPQPLTIPATGEDYIDGEGMLPPHEMVARRWAREKIACSVCTGQGRTLKGRDLRHVRNSVLRLTGFLER
ncbi:uncharacterized protein LOC110095327 [Dendrobium catenatum]|uniref:Uncharacterized protein n=1 Tax=Dendrobium catenatum TaxID=906689 RepID=A0A2I0WYE8_9ASPA|nr:uncharacterized protein LOC110095327 [Dendrobium catenatum]PKU80679.1 hypothetical protein MA16_Dca012437 [Dendrobium catenatum]